jgi:hypothetical protein
VDEDRTVFTLCIIIFVRSKVLPTKSIQQCYLQTQRLLGQQSLAEFMSLHVNIDKILEDNVKKQVGILLLRILGGQEVRVSCQLGRQTHQGRTHCHAEDQQ